MVAFEIPQLRFAGNAGAVVERRRFVKVDATGNIVKAAAGDAVLAVSMSEAVKANEVVDLSRGIVMVEAAGAVAANAKVASDAEGKAVTYATGDIAGIAVTSAAAAGELISVLLK